MLASCLPLLLTLSCSAPDEAATQAEPQTPPTPGSETAAAAPDLILILLDGVRSDLPDSPSTSLLLESLEGPWRQYRSAYAQSVQPYVSLASLMVGRYPSAVPVCGRPEGGQAERPWCTRIPSSQRSLPEILSIYGYQDALFSLNAPETQDLEEIYSHHRRLEGSAAGSWQHLRDQAQQWWEQQQDSPRFLSLVVSVDALELTKRAGMDPLVISKSGMTEEQQAEVQEAYEQTLRDWGAELSRSLGTLSGERERWVLISSAHGLSLGRRSGTLTPAHLNGVDRKMLLERTLHVPLLLQGPGVSAGVREEIVELVDVLPTLLSRTGAMLPAELPGEDLLPEPGAESAGWAYAEFGDMFALREGDWLTVYRSFLHGGSSLSPENTERMTALPVVLDKHYTLHDVVNDPYQEFELSGTFKRRVQKSRERLIAIRTGQGAPPEGGLSWDQVQALHSTGATGYW